MEVFHNYFSGQAYKMCFTQVFGQQLENKYDQEESQEKMNNCLQNYLKTSSFSSSQLTEYIETVPKKLTIESITE